MTTEPTPTVEELLGEAADDELAAQIAAAEAEGDWLTASRLKLRRAEARRPRPAIDENLRSQIADAQQGGNWTRRSGSSSRQASSRERRRRR